jgi:hypothetical protein
VLLRDAVRLYRVQVNALTGATRAWSRLERRNGVVRFNALLQPVAAEDSGIAGVQALNRLEQGLFLLTTRQAQWIWRPGMKAQGVATATVPQQLQLWAFNGSTDVGPTITFPDTAPGEVVKVPYLTVNTGSTSIKIIDEHLADVTAFRLYGVPILPWQLDANQMSALGLQFSPPDTGVYTTTLTLRYRDANDDNAPLQSVVYTLTGSGTAAPPRMVPALTLDNPAPASGANVEVKVSFSQTSSTPLSGYVQLRFVPGSTTLADDPTATLVSAETTSRIQDFTVLPGGTTAMFGAQDHITLNTGTTQGIFQLTAVAGTQSDQKTFTIAAAPPVLPVVALTRATTGLQLVTQGWDNTHTASHVVFTFYTDTAGTAVVSPGDISLDVTQSFSRYFSDNPLMGGKFRLSAFFPVTGDLAAIKSVRVRLVNSAGSTPATALAQ